ncbi:MAG: hypothetical protein EBU01_15270 [Crocinitomicaceae bacterium]|nr:hypothetical protein [Crocinitomicaceae bacterium]
MNQETKEKLEKLGDLNSSEKKEAFESIIKNTDYDCTKHTEGLRKYKPSETLKREAVLLNVLIEKNKEKYEQTPNEFKEECAIQCPFLFGNYPSIFTKMYKKEINMLIFYKLVQTMKKIEDGEIDHAEGSKIFSEIGLAFYKSKQLNDDTTMDEPSQEIQHKKENAISWTEYKKTILQK